MGEYDQYGKLCTRAMAGKSSFLVDRSPLKILDDTLKNIGFDLRGAMAGAKFLLNKKVKCPIMVNPYQGIYLFPNKSPFKKECIWFNPEHIVKTKAVGKKTIVEFSNGHSILLDSKLPNFNSKIQSANQLKRLSIERGTNQNPITFYLAKDNNQLIKEKAGKYNFGVLEDEKSQD